MRPEYDLDAKDREPFHLGKLDLQMDMAVLLEILDPHDILKFAYLSIEGTTYVAQGYRPRTIDIVHRRLPSLWDHLPPGNCILQQDAVVPGPSCV